jgi:hypothetical protein
MLTHLYIFTVASYISKMPTKKKRKFGKTSEMKVRFCFVIFMRAHKRHNAGKDNGDDKCMLF